MIDDTAIEVSRSPDKLKEFLAVQAKFDMYSAANTLLIFKQIPNATQLKSLKIGTRTVSKFAKSKRV